MIPNYDAAADIHYGVINLHTANPDAVQDIYSNGTNLTHGCAVEEAKATIAAALTKALDSIGILPSESSYADRKAARREYISNVVESVWNDVEQDFNDAYEEDNDTYRYDRDGYTLETSSLGIYVIKAPFYTFAAQCSPCCPNAGDLNTPRDGGLKTYCLGPDWFDEESRPEYPIYSVETNEPVTV